MECPAQSPEDASIPKIATEQVFDAARGLLSIWGDGGLP